MPVRPLARPLARPLSAPGTGYRPVLGGGGQLTAAWAFQDSALDLDFQGNTAAINAYPAGAATSRLTITRTTTGYAQAQSGIWTSFSSGQFRQTDKGLLVEEIRTNNLLQCRDMTNAAWAKGATVTVAQTQTGIDGGANSATLVTGGAVQATNTVLQTITLGVATDTYSVFIKRITGSGTIEISGDGAAWTAVVPTASYQQFQVTASLTNPVCGVRIATNGDQIACDFSQLETGAFATSPILTTGATATRNADIVQLASPTLISPTQGSWFAEWNEVIGPVSVTGPLVYMRLDGNNTVQIMRNSGNKANLTYKTAGSSVASLSSTNSLVANTVYRAAVRYGLDDFNAKYSASLGADPAPDTSGAIFGPPLTNVWFGNDGATASNNGYVRRATWFAGKLSDSALSSWAQGTVGP